MYIGDIVCVCACARACACVRVHVRVRVRVCVCGGTQFSEYTKVHYFVFVYLIVL
jgi:hypothetical protein